MKTKFISVLLTLSMAAGYLFSVPAFADSPSFSGGSGTEEDPYLISTAEDMWSLSDECKDKPQHTEMYTGKYFKVTNDIDLGCSEDKQWMPIADYDGNNIRFCGTFDGDGHTISGLYINGQSKYVGLFGMVQDWGHSIINLNVEGYVKGSRSCGGIVGRIYNYASIRNCSFKGEVSGTYDVGGIVGSTSSRSSINGCTVSGKITGSNTTGGIVGYHYVGQSFTDCTNQATVTGTASVGGLVGEMWLSSPMTGCYNSGEVKGTNDVGGLVGYGLQIGDITGCYNTGNVTGTNNVGGIYGYCAPDANIKKCYNTGGITAESVGGGIAGYMISGTYIENCYNLGNVTATENAGGIGGIYSSSSLGDYKNTKMVNVYNIGRVTAAENSGGVFGYNRSESLRSTADIVTSTACYIDTACNKECAGTKLTAAQLASESTFSGWSSFSDNWIMSKGAGRPMLKEVNEGVEISTADDLVELYENVKSGNRYSNVYIYLKNDIDMDGINWFPIGTYDKDENRASPFLGNFNGNGHTISNLNCDAGSEEYQGLFGYVGAGGQVRNVIMDDSCFFSAGEHTAAIAGLNAGTIENCKNYAEVIGDEYTGGIVGENAKGGLVTKCYNAGAISSTASEVGGIVGYNIEGTISKCANDGSVDADASFSGGIVGQNHTGTVTNCYSTGEVRAVRAYSGGVAGQSIGGGAKVSNCYSYGRVYSYEICGGVAGSNKNSSVIETCYYLEDMADGGISGENSPRSAQDVSGSAQKLTETQFANQSSFSGWNFSTVWLMGSDKPYLECAVKLEGSGTEDDPYIIDSVKTLAMLRAMVTLGKTTITTHFRVTEDLDLGDALHIPIGINYAAPFKGAFDGGGHTISGLNIQNAGSTTGNYGLFGYVSEGSVVKNINAEGNIAFDGSDANVSQVGGIAGVCYGTIENCSFSGNIVNNTTSTPEIGGIVGTAVGDIFDCHFDGSITVKNSSTFQAEGGIAGALLKGIISRCYNTADIIGGFHVGGIVGDVDVYSTRIAVENCYNTGSVKCLSQNGDACGIVGYSSKSSGSNKTIQLEINNCYNTGTLTGKNNNVMTYALYGTPIIENCYYLTGSGTENTGSTAVTTEQLASGEIAYLLQNGNADTVWGQTLKGDETDTLPILTSDTNKTVHKITYFTKSNSNYATTYGNGEGVSYIPSYSGADFTGWSLADGKFLTEDTPITSDITVNAASQEMYGETDGDKTIRIDYGKGASVDLSQYIVYQKGTSTKEKYTYTINSGNSSLNATVSGDTLTIPTSASVGTYNLSVTATEKTPNISLMSVSFDNLPVTMSITVVVGKRDATVTAPKAKTLTYNALEQELVLAGTATGGTLMYSLDGTNYSADIPKGTNAGDYTVYYKVDGGNEFDDIAAQSITVTISQKNAELTNPTPNAAVYGTKLSAITLPEGWQWTDTSVVPPVKNNGYEAVYTVTDYTNYDWSGVSGYDSKTHTVNRTIKPAIIKANPVVTPPAGKSLKTTGEMQELIYAGKTTGGTLVYSLDGTNYSADIPKAKDKGNYTVYYKVIGDDNYNDTAQQTITAELGKADIPADKITYPQANRSLEYNRIEQELVTAGTTIEGTKFLYSLDNKTYSEEIPTAVNAGKYVVYYKVDGGELYNDMSARAVNVAIAKQNPAFDVIGKAFDLYAKIDSQNPTYGIKLSDIELTEYFEWVDSSIVPEVDYADKNGYPAIMHIEDDENYDWDGVEGYDPDNNIWWIDLPFEMVKADITNVTAPAAKELTYTGNAQELVTRGSAEGGTVEYSLDGENYTDAVPVAINAGDYTVYYKAVGDSNHNDTDAKTVKVTIAKKKPMLTVPDVRGQQVVYGAKLSEISLPEGWSWADGTITPTVNNNGYDAKITIDYDANYDWESVDGYNSTTHTVTRTLAVTVRKAPSDEAVPTDLTATYGETLSAVTLPNGWTWDNPSQSVGNAGTRLFAATYTPDDTDNYEGINANISVEVRKTDPVVTAPEAKDITYTGLAQELVTAASTTGGTLLYSIDGDNYFTSIPKGRNAGDYTVHYMVEGDGNYNDVEEQTIIVTIKKATPNLTVSMQNWMFGGDVPDPVINGNVSDGEVTFEYKAKDADDNTYSSDKPVDAGNYTIRATVAETTNYKGAIVTADFTVSEPSDKPVAKILTYNGNEQELVSGGDDSYEYKLDGGEYSSEVPKATKAGTYIVYYKTGTSSEHTLEVTIRQQPVTLETPEISNTVIYGTHLYEIPLDDGWNWSEGDTVPEVNNVGSEAVYNIRMYNNEEYNEEYNEEGTEDENYKNYAWSNVEGFDEETLTVRRVVAVTVQKAEVTITLPRVKMLTYTGKEQELITAGSVQDGQMLYSLDNTEFSTNVPVAVNAGSYTVYYKATGDSNHNDGATGSVTVTIFPQDITLTVPQPRSVMYGKKLSEIPLDSGWIWADGDTVPAVNNNGYEAKYKVEDADNPNYSWLRVEGYDSETQTVTRIIPLTVIKASAMTEIPQDLTATYGEKLSDIALPDGWEWQDGETSVGKAGTRAFTAIYTPADTENYEALQADITVIVGKAESEVSEPQSKTLTYNGIAQELISAPEVSGGTVLYSLDGEKYSTAVPSGKDAGEYTVYYKVKGDENHLDTEPETLTISIEKADIPLDVLMMSRYENEEPSEPIIYGNTGKGVVTYEYKLQNSDDSEYSETMPRTRGVYKIKATAAETKNYNGASVTSYFVILPSESSEEYSLMFIDEFLYITVPHGGPCTVIFAAYKDGILQNVSCEERVFSDASADIAVMPEQITDGNPDEVRAMLWSSLTDMVPLCSSEIWQGQ